MDYKYDIALSFAGEDRAYVEEVANFLRDFGISVFYDSFEQIDLWGKNLYTHLRRIYKDYSRYTIIFCSEHYAKKQWTNHERESAQERAFTENREYILPARFDNTEIPGIQSTVGYINLAEISSFDFAKIIATKLGKSPSVDEKSNSLKNLLLNVNQENLEIIGGLFLLTDFLSSTEEAIHSLSPLLDEYKTDYESVYYGIQDKERSLHGDLQMLFKKLPKDIADVEYYDLYDDNQPLNHLFGRIRRPFRSFTDCTEYIYRGFINPDNINFDKVLILLNTARKDCEKARQVLTKVISTY